MAKIRVFIVDDSPEWRTIIRRKIMFQEAFSLVGTASSSDEAITRIPYATPDIILMDVEMNGNISAGADTISALIEKGVSAKFIIITNCNRKDVILDAFRGGASDFIAKDHLEALPDLIQNIFHRITPTEILAQEHRKLLFKMARQSQLEILSDAEKEVWSCLENGMARPEISEMLHRSENTIKTQISSILHKFGVKNRKEAMKKVYKAVREYYKKIGQGEIFQPSQKKTNVLLSIQREIKETRDLMENYVEKALRTEVRDYTPVVERLSNSQTIATLRYVLEHNIEQANMADQLKRHIFYGTRDLPQLNNLTMKELIQKNKGTIIGECGDNDATWVRIIHAILGLNTEQAELSLMFYECFFQGKQFNITNAKEEIGDMFWYAAIAIDVLKTTIQEIMAMNISKLAKRYPDLFNEHNAVNRTLEAEFNAMDVAPGAIRECDKGHYEDCEEWGAKKD
jgi:two-component system response regulator DevR